MLTIPTFLCSIKLVEVVEKNSPRSICPTRFLLISYGLKNAKIAQKLLFFIQNWTYLPNC